MELKITLSSNTCAWASRYEFLVASRRISLVQHAINLPGQTSDRAFFAEGTTLGDAVSPQP